MLNAAPDPRDRVEVRRIDSQPDALTCPSQSTGTSNAGSANADLEYPLHLSSRRAHKIVDAEPEFGEVAGEAAS